LPDSLCCVMGTKKTIENLDRKFVVNYKKIMVPLDGSGDSTRVLKWAGGLSRSLGCELALFVCVNPPRDNGQQNLINYKKEIVTNAHHFLTQETQSLNNQGINVSMHISEGDPVSEIIDFAKSSKCDLIAMATSGRSLLGRGLLGSVTFDVLNKTTLPVMTTTSYTNSEFTGFNGGPGTIIVPLDGSGNSEIAVPTALHIASKAKARLKFLKVIKIQTDFTENHWAPANGNYILDQELKHAEKYLSYFKEVARKKNIRNVTSTVAIGSPAIRIMDDWDAYGGELIVMGTNGKTGLTRLILGSVTDSVMRASDKPVIIINDKRGKIKSIKESD